MQIYPIIGLIILISGFLTQLIRIRRTRRVDGISPGAIRQLILCCLLFSGYHLGNSHLIALTLNLCLLSISVAILILYYKHRHSPG